MKRNSDQNEKTTDYPDVNIKDTDILLVMPPPWGVDVPPLGIACLSSYLHHKGIKVEVFDFNIELYNMVPDEFKYLWNMGYADQWHDERYSLIRQNLSDYIELLIQKILQFPQRIIGISLPTNCPDLIVVEVVQRIKEKNPNKKIILGGVSITIKEQRFDLLKKIKGYVDFCILGEGEKILYELIKKISENKFSEIEKLEGVIPKEKANNHKEKAKIQNWDLCPYPTFEGFETKKYTTNGKSLPIEFSRGCKSKCPFCDFNNVFSSFKTKSARNIIDQISYYINKYEINHLSVVDAAVNGDIKNLAIICDLLIDQNIQISMSALAIPRRETTYDLLKKMKKAGFYRLEYGLESGSDRILKSMRKMFSSKTAEKVMRDTHRAGIQNYLYLMVGYPGETEDDLNETKKFLEDNAKYITSIRSINPLYIMAGSEIFNNHQKYHIVLPSEESDRKWYIGSQNTYDIRKNRVADIKLFAKHKNISFLEDAESLEFTLDKLSETSKSEKKN
jgi:radical SAM superfamily enzyme YgiQ (UPF0313 family)